MRIWLLILVALGWGGLVIAQPVPPPPEDYSGRQYIGADGCVFHRDHSGWAPRLDADGAPFCGFPPTEFPALDGADQAPLSSAERLSALLEQGLRPGEHESDATLPEERSTGLAETYVSELGTILTRDGVAALRPARALPYSEDRRAMICGRLGYLRAEPRSGDVTGGLCLGQAALANGRADRSDPKKARSVKSLEEGNPHPAKLRRGNPAPVPRPRANPAQQMSVVLDPVSVPAKAQYVQLGAARDQTDQQELGRRITAMGYPVARLVGAAEKTDQSILAGPFKDRQSLIRALDHLRRSGFPDAKAR